MIIKEHKTIKGLGKEQHHQIIIDWFDREWKILVNENALKKITIVYLWDNDKWRLFDGHTIEESIVYDALKTNKVVNLNYRIQ